MTGTRRATRATVRKAVASDVAAIVGLVRRFAEENLMLPRNAGSVYSALRDFAVAVDGGGEVLACCALSIIAEGLAEVRSLSVAPEAQGLGLGSLLVKEAVAEARALGVPRVFALTRVPAFFERLGFAVADMSALPQKVWRDCIHCPLFPNCDEVALVRDLE